MNETLVYDAARDTGGGLTIMNIATACIIAGFALIAIPTILSIRRQPERRRRGIMTLAATAAIALLVVFGLRTLDHATKNAANPETIEGVVGSITPTLITVGGMKVMIACADPTHCPGLAVGDNARVAYVEDSGPETDALATRIWKQSPPAAAQ